MLAQIHQILHRLTFQKQLSITVSLGILLVALFASLLTSWQSNQRVYDDLVRQGKQLTQIFAQQSHLALAFGATENAEEAIKMTMAFPGVVALEIRDTNHQLLASKGKINWASLPTNQENLNNSEAKLVAENEWAWRYNAAVYANPDGSNPFSGEVKQELLGHVSLVISKETLKAMTKEVLIANLTSSVAIALLLLLVIRKITRNITRPLAQLSHSMGRAQNGEQSVRATPSGPQDIANMAHAFNRMMHVQEEREAELRIAAIAFDIDEGMIVTDNHARIIRANRAFCRLMGYLEHELLGNTPAMLHSTQQSEEFHQKMKQSLNEHHIWQGEIWNKRKDGDVFPFWLSITAVLNEQNQVTHYVAGYIDIAQQKQTETAMQQLNEHLKQAVNQAEAASKAKSRFLANMSHELRTPMNAIIGMNTMALAKVTDPQVVSQLKTVQQASEHLLAIINDILDLSKIESERLELEHTDFKLEWIFDKVLALFANKALEKGLQLNLNIAAELTQLDLNGDPLRIGQILINFISNALKFTKQGKIEIRCSLLAQTNSEIMLRFEVRDTGIGISEEAQQRLFNDFEQADNSTTRQFGGTGLGLAISKRLVQLMAGEIGVNSLAGKGSTFWFTCKLAPCQHTVSINNSCVTQEQLAQQIIERHQGTSVLLVEDDFVNQIVASDMLEQLGLVVEIANNGLEAVELAKSKQYQLILMDLQMPEMNGLDATRVIRSFSQIPIIAMTANTFVEDQQACFTVGMNAHIGKPIDKKILYEVLLRFLMSTEPR